MLQLQIQLADGHAKANSQTKNKLTGEADAPVLLVDMAYLNN